MKAKSVNTLGTYIKEELEERGWSQRDLANILSCPEQSIALIIDGKKRISYKMAKALAVAFDVSTEFFSNLKKVKNEFHF